MATQKDNKRKKLKLYLTVTAGLVVMAAACVVPAAPPAGKGGGGDAGNTPVCITFTDVPGDGVQSDGQDPYAPDIGDPYCNDKKQSIEALMDGHGYVELRPNTSNDPDGGRRLFVNLGRTIDLIGKPGISVQTTDDLFANGISYYTRMNVGGVDLRAIPVGEGAEATLRFYIHLNYPDATIGALLIHYDPGYERYGCTSLDSTTVSVMRVDTDRWVVQVDSAVDRAALIEAYKDGTRANVPVEWYCRTQPEGAEDMLSLPSFAFEIALAP